MSIIAISNKYKIRPSQIIELKDSYESFCFDEAVTYITAQLESEDSPIPRWRDEKGRIKQNNNKDVIKWMKGH
ncbi:hypothetical protein CBC3_01485 [Clostridium botulinum V891]|nr:hypothetical protein CBC3_01485 [Clostridium botulinum V891]